MISLIVIGAIGAYVFIAGLVYAALEGVEFTLDGDRGAVSWLWPVSGPLYVLWLVGCFGIAAPRLIGEAIVSHRERAKRLPKAQARRG